VAKPVPRLRELASVHGALAGLAGRSLQELAQMACLRRVRQAGSTWSASELVGVVPRTWTHLIAEAAGQPIDPATPTPLPWREYAAQRTGLAAPEQMTDGAAAAFTPFESGYDPADPADQAIMATRNEVFPRWIPLYKIIYRQYYRSTGSGQPPARAPSEPDEPPTLE
jgi:hypothetical protein